MLLGRSIQYLTERKDADVVWERERPARMQAGCPRSQRSLPNGTVVQAKVLATFRLYRMYDPHGNGRVNHNNYLSQENKPSMIIELIVLKLAETLARKHGWIRPRFTLGHVLAEGSTPRTSAIPGKPFSSDDFIEHPAVKRQQEERYPPKKI
jgi:hypothetical protein